MTNLNTPWGLADHVDHMSDQGILFVSTASHGGVFVPDELLDRMPRELRGSNSYSGKRNWFEEDVEWAIPVLAFPDQFSPEYCKAAVETIEAYGQKKRGEYLFSAVQWLAGTAGDAVKKRAGLPIVGDSNINTCFGGAFAVDQDYGGVLGPDNQIYSDADPGL